MFKKFQGSEALKGAAEYFDQLDDADWLSPLQDYSKELLDTLFSPITTVSCIKECGKKIVEVRGNFIFIMLMKEGINFNLLIFAFSCILNEGRINTTD